MDKTLKVDRETLFYAFRYALGRASFAPSVVMDNIKANIDDLSIGDVKAYIKEIGECKHLGMDMDESEWLRFKDYLEDVLNNCY